jgi:hypothetical protein
VLVVQRCVRLGSNFRMDPDPMLDAWQRRGRVGVLTLSKDEQDQKADVVMAYAGVVGRHSIRSGQRNAEAGSLRSEQRSDDVVEERRGPVMALMGHQLGVTRHYSAEGQQHLTVFRPRTALNNTKIPWSVLKEESCIIRKQIRGYSPPPPFSNTGRVPSKIPR